RRARSSSPHRSSPSSPPPPAPRVRRRPPVQTRRRLPPPPRRPRHWRPASRRRRGYRLPHRAERHYETSGSSLAWSSACELQERVRVAAGGRGKSLTEEVGEHGVAQWLPGAPPHLDPPVVGRARVLRVAGT